MFKIKRLSDGLYARGGSDGVWGPPYNYHFSKRGKVWSTAGALSGHLTMLNAGALHPVYENCVVVEFDENGSPPTETSVADYYAALRERTRRTT